MHSYRLTHLKELESESMHILREVASQFDNPTLLFSGGQGQQAVEIAAHIELAPLLGGQGQYKVRAHHVQHRGILEPR